MNVAADFVRRCDVAIIGGGPAGLAAATALKGRGVRDVIVLEREPVAGGIPRHCAHSPFGMREFRRVFAGPRYARELVDRARFAGAEIWTKTNVVQWLPRGRLRIATEAGLAEILARRVIYACGVREKSRAARLISGARPRGVLNTGPLQSLVHEYGMRPFTRPVIVGTELVAFSAMLTCRKAGIRPVAMLEKNPRVSAYAPTFFFPALQGVPLHLGTRLLRILGQEQVRAVLVQGPDASQREIPCDGVLLSGDFRPESSLCQSSHLEWDMGTLGPLVDQFGRCSDPVCFAAGNVLRPVETAGWSWNEGRKIGEIVARDLQGAFPEPHRFVDVRVAGEFLQYVMPQRLNISAPPHAGTLEFQLRVKKPVKGILFVRAGRKDHELKRISSRPERRIIVHARDLMALKATGPLVFGIRPV